MAASGRDALRFTTFVPLLERSLDSGDDDDASSPTELFEDLGTLPDLISKTEQLLQFALDHDQHDRVERLLALSSRLASLRDQALATYGPEVNANELRVSRQLPTSSEQPASSEAAVAESDCPICFDTFPTADGRGLLQCGHLYCQTCLAAHFETKIADGQIQSVDMKCPDPSCDATAEAYELEALVSRDSYARYCELVTLASLRPSSGAAADANMVWCPVSSCSEAILLGPADTGDVECPTCHAHFCAACKLTPYHTGKSCDEAKASQHKDPTADRLMGSYMTAAGNHIVCIDCKYEWCWLCRRHYYVVEYGHYNSGRCKGLQFCPVNSIEEVEAIRARKKAFLGLTIGTLGLAAPLMIWYKKQHPNID